MTTSLKLHVLNVMLLILVTFSFNPDVEAKQLRVFYSSLPPYEDILDNGTPYGIGIEAINGYFSKEQSEVLFEYFSVARGILELHRGRVDFSTAIAPTKAVNNQFWVSTDPLYHIQLGVFRRASTLSISKPEELSESKFVSLKGTSFYYLDAVIPTLNASNNHYRVDYFDLAAGILRNGKSDYFLSYYYPKKHTAFFDLEFDQFMTVPVHLILSKQHPDAEKLKQLIIRN